MTNDHLLVSVIIPVYNRANTLSIAIESVLAQTFKDFEIIVIDDYSTDNSASIATNFPQVRMIRHESNKGAAAARNTGINTSRGKYVAFLDSDDLWLPEKLQIQINYLENNIGMAVCVSAYHLFLPKQKPTLFIPSSPVNWKKHLLMGCNLGPGSTLVARRECFQRIGLFDVGLPRYEDWDWLIRLVEFVPITVINRPLANVFRYGIPTARSIEIGNKIFLEKHKQSFTSFGFWYGQKAISKRWTDVSYYYFIEHNWGKGIKYFLKTVITYPFQGPGFYIRILDSILGTDMWPTVGQWKTKFVNRLDNKSF